MRDAVLIITAILHAVAGCGPICHCDINYTSQRIFTFSGNTYIYPTLNYIANCSARHLNKMPHLTDSSFSILYLDYNNITLLSNNFFNSKGLNRLNSLYLNNNSISEVEKDAFVGLTILERLNLDGNKITSLPETVFEPCIKLRYLSMSGNNLILPNAIFINNIELVDSLILSYCNLKTLPSSLAMLKLNELDISNNNELGLNITLNFSAQFLKVSNNGNVDLSKKGTDLSSLRTLDLSHNNLLTKVEFYLSTPRLEILNLAWCRLSNAYENIIKNGSQVKVLDLSNNYINNLKFNVFKSLINLEELYLQENGISYIEPKTLENNEKLIKLNLSKNSLELSHENIFLNSSSLKFLYISNNKIDSITNTTFQKLPMLQLIDMRNNCLRSLNEDCFHNLPYLEQLFLDGNRIRTISSTTFIHNIHLIELTLSSNPIKIPRVEPFLQAPPLSVLALNHCNITYIPQNMFKNTPYLRRILLSNNSLSVFEVNVIQQLKKLYELDLRGNPLICDSHLKKVFSWCLKNGVEGHAQCATPKGDWKMLEHLHLDENVDTHPIVIPEDEEELEAQHRNQEPPSTSTNLSGVLIFTILVLGLVLGAAAGVILHVYILRRYHWFSFRRINHLSK